ncbi:MAG TPA: electron transport complex subunit E [bacterium]|nr:electron transport complex subunit E [bacterium]HPN95282.1 electron transport complex subunit E [bacterium]
MLNELTKGIFRENPLLRLLLGTCPSLAVTSSLENGIGMGAATTFVLLCSNALVSLIKGIVPSKVRIPVFVVIIATFVTITDLSMSAYVPDLHKNLGLFIPLIVVNCIILGRAEAFASKNGILPSLLDGLGMGIGYTLALCLIGSIREILGAGTLLGASLFGPAYQPFLMFVLPAGAFLTLGLTMGVMNWLEKRKA